MKYRCLRRDYSKLLIREWSSITGRGGLQNERGGGVSEVLSLQKGGGGKGLAILMVGHNKFWGSFNTGA